jgi:hypothetical protein
MPAQAGIHDLSSLPPAPNPRAVLVRVKATCSPTPSCRRRPASFETKRTPKRINPVRKTRHARAGGHPRLVFCAPGLTLAPCSCASRRPAEAGALRATLTRPPSVAEQKKPGQRNAPLRQTKKLSFRNGVAPNLPPSLRAKRSNPSSFESRLFPPFGTCRTI